MANVQVCIRTQDIDEVGDETHHTLFEMLGNWSLGDYFKDEAIKFSFEFLTSKKWLSLEKEKLAISVFEGDSESEKIWLDLGIPKERIKELGEKDNWWGPAGQTGPCGPDTEMFYWSGEKQAPKEFNPEDKKWVEIWNDVFMQYFKNMDGKYEPLPQKNVDTGMGLERVLRVKNRLNDDYQSDVFLPIIQKIEELSQKQYGYHKKITDNYGSFSPNVEIDKSGDWGYVDRDREMRIIADHIKAATFIIGDKRGVEPSNLGQGYVVRRLIRRAIRYGKRLGLPENFLNDLVIKVIEIYGGAYPYIKEKENYIKNVIQKEAEKFEKTLEQGLKEFEKNTDPFILFTTYGFPIELTQELAREKGREIDIEKFNEDFKKHQELSRTASSGMFKGGLADAGIQATKYHTATHLLLAALRKVLGEHVYQRGSNINTERLRFDFSHSEKMTDQEIKKVEDLVNEKIKEGLEVVCEEMPLEKAKKEGAVGIFENKYGEKVKVYSVAEFSKEICGGPHVKRTSELGSFKIIKEESSASGVRRIRAVLIQK